MTIDITKIRPGDRVTLVPLRVDSLRSEAILVASGYGQIKVTTDQIAAHHPAPREFQVGDRVTYIGGGVGTIRGIDGDLAWVKWYGSISNWTVAASDLTLVEGGE